ncbi:MAG: glycerol-3-phosphate 1-O-acyltransferase PlsY [Bdellovibrionales bacterium]
MPPDFSAFFITAVGMAYLLGSIPFGLLLTRIAGMGDIRKIGSGNIGATNVLRTGNKRLAALTLFLDGAKGAAAVLIAQIFFPGCETYAALAAMLGHLFPVWLRGRGGKGVATAIGVLAALSLPVGITICAVWLLVAWLSRYSSLAALVAIGLSPLYALAFGRNELIWLTIVIVMLVFAKHRANIERLMKGRESKIGKK